jgi:hypothetical protein
MEAEMDGRQFDGLVKTLGTTPSRRQILRGLAGAAAAGAATLVTGKEATQARGKRKKKSRRGRVETEGVRWGNWSHSGCCLSWDTPSYGYRTYSAILWDIPWGQSWEKTCASTSATVVDVYGTGHHFDRPTRCNKCGFYMCGYFDVRDSACDSAPRCATVGFAW